ncbi:MAG: preprotein translocase subunit SecA, partial [Microbacteriaceae bacterium]
GYMYNLEVEIKGEASQEEISARGLNDDGTPAAQLSYSAPSDDGSVEVRNDRGQIQQPARGRGQAQQPQAQQKPAIGAFGQRTEGAADAATPLNREQRRNQGKKRKGN